jgi:beta-lactam-binding protein with PASTA domain
MPSLVGLTYSAATARAATAGLHLVATADTPPPTENPASASPTPTTPPSAPATPDASAPVAPTRPTGIITAQIPQAGRRVARGDAIHVTLAHPTPAAAPLQ